MNETSSIEKSSRDPDAMHHRTDHDDDSDDCLLQGLTIDMDAVLDYLCDADWQIGDRSIAIATVMHQHAAEDSTRTAHDADSDSKDSDDETEVDNAGDDCEDSDSDEEGDDSDDGSHQLDEYLVRAY